MRTTLIVPIDSSSELLVGHAEGVEHDYTIILTIGARLGLLNGRVECQMVDLRAVFGRSITQNLAGARSNEPTYIVWDANTR